MARIMTLDGPQISDVRARLDLADRPLSGIVQMIGAHALWVAVAVGALAGMVGAARGR